MSSSAITLIVITSILAAPHAEAAESPVDLLVDFAREKIIRAKKLSVENEKELEKKETKKQPLVERKETKAKREEKIQSPDDHKRELEEAVNFASEKTGVRKDFLMGMLVVESDLGRNTGECTYKEVSDGAEKAYQNGQLSQKAWNTFLERKEIIKQVAESTGRDYEKVRVSCNPSRYAGTGGAMGVPQFMPDIWMLYKDKIAKTVGKDNPDPWNLKDGVVAMALLLADTPGVTEHSAWAERNAAKMYLSGTTSWQYDWYANQIFYWASNYRKLLG